MRGYWAPFALVAPEDARLFAEGGRPRFQFTADRFQRAIVDNEFVNEKLVRRVWDALRWEALGDEAQALVPPVVLSRKPDAPEVRVYKPRDVFKMLRSIQHKEKGRGDLDFVNAFVGLANHVFTTLCNADDVLLACQVPEGVPSASSPKATDAKSTDMTVIMLSQTKAGEWFVGVSGPTASHYLIFGKTVEVDYVTQELQSCCDSLHITNRSILTGTVFPNSQPTDSCIRACAAAWTAACFRSEDFSLVWSDVQWQSDAFVAGTMPAEEAARLALAHAVVGCSPSLNKALAARKFLKAAVDLETKARRVKLAAAQDVGEARRVNAALQMEEGDARRVAMAMAPDTFPSEQYPYNSAHHLYLWTPALDPRHAAKTG
jgi:hypothetical protein